ncbi:alanine tRS, partial [Acrasis kona]
MSSNVDTPQEIEWPANRVRQTFIDFFGQKKQHVFVPSSSVIPHNDNTILFANAGMNQFKPIFLGTADPNSDLGKMKRAVNTQKCIRAGGKHNDLDDVGKDTYHHTFFEMLGNWSFGDYFKKEAIAWAWELLTEVYGMEKDRLYATYFEGDAKQGLEPDEEARQLWLQYLPTERVLPGNTKDNFWEMGDEGPCGPCSEIHYDRIGGRNAASLVNADDPNVIEIWNIVFIQYNREPDRSLRLLPDKHVDTGMGFERLTSILQNKFSNYDTDVFQPIFTEIQKVTGAAPYRGKLGKEDENSVDTAYRVIADHIRTLTVALSDGGIPDAVGRGYVLRRIVRRAVRYGSILEGNNSKPGFFSNLVSVVVKSLGHVFPTIQSDPESIRKIIYDEEVKFSRTLKTGEKFFKLRADEALKNGSKIISGADAFELYATYGFPVDLTQLMAEELQLNVDKIKFEEERARHALISAKEKNANVNESTVTLDVNTLKELNVAHKAPLTDDSHRYVWEPIESTVVAIYDPKQGFVNHISFQSDSYCAVILDKTNFYAEGGGQIYDTGFLSHAFQITNTQSSAGYVVHSGKLTDSESSLTVGQQVTCVPDFEKRLNTASNHTATHMLNYALRKVLGDKCDQKGSFVNQDGLRFDYTCSAQPKPSDLVQIEQIVNDLIRKNVQVNSRVARREQAEKIAGLRAMFGEYYPDEVRVVSIGVNNHDHMINAPDDEQWKQYSVEFCGGTHLQETSQAVNFVLISEGSISAGVRRIEAVTRSQAQSSQSEFEHFDARIKQVDSIDENDSDAFVRDYTTLSADLLKLKNVGLINKLNLQQRAGVLYERRKQIAKAQEKILLDRAARLGNEHAADVNQSKCLCISVDDSVSRAYCQAFAKNIKVPLLLIGNAEGKDNMVAYFCSVPKGSKLSAKEWVAK